MHPGSFLLAKQVAFANRMYRNLRTELANFYWVIARSLAHEPFMSLLTEAPRANPRRNPPTKTNHRGVITDLELGRVLIDFLANGLFSDFQY
jgi:hypothetical protein